MSVTDFQTPAQVISAEPIPDAVALAAVACVRRYCPPDALAEVIAMLDLPDG